MVWLVRVGALVTIAGLGLLIWCMIQALKARRSGLDDAALRARMQRLVRVNLGALALSAIGLASVIVGVFLS